MNISRVARNLSLAAIAMACFVTPAAAQFFWKPADLHAAPVEGHEPNLGFALPGATQSEYRAALLWSMRAGLNVAALQCQFEPTLLTLSNYNAMIAHHDDELANAFSTLTSYFKRVEGKRGQNALDQYGTRIYLGYSTVSAQYNFCETAASIGRDAIFQPRGTLYQLAQKRIGELRNALVPHGEQAFGNPAYNFRANLPSLDDKCWKKTKLRSDCREEWDERLKLAAQANGAAKPIQ